MKQTPDHGTCGIYAILYAEAISRGESTAHISDTTISRYDVREKIINLLLTFQPSALEIPIDNSLREVVARILQPISQGRIITVIVMAKLFTFWCLEEST